MKKIKTMAITVTIAMLLSTFTFGCKEPEDPTNPENNTEETAESGEETKEDEKKSEEEDKKDEDSDEPEDEDEDSDDDEEDSSALQALLEAAQSGGTVTLDASVKGTKITIAKKLTVDGNGIANLTVEVNPEYADKVTLKNFVNAKITIKEASDARKARMARSVTNARSAAPDPAPSKPREIGDQNPKLYFENCSFEKISAEEDISLYLKEDSLKCSIKEIELKKGLDSFVVIEEDSENLAKEKKSAIDKISIEKGVDEVELLGGYYKDIEFKGEFTADDKVDFYYDEKGNQVEDTFKSRLAEQSTKVDAKDICNVKNGNGIYKFRIPAAEAEHFNNGTIGIILLKDNQKQAFLNSSNSMAFPWATVAEPYFEITSTGYYLFENFDSNVHGVYGVSTWNFNEFDSGITFDKYKNYSVNGICSQNTTDGLSIYIDLSKVLKSDIATCAFEEDGQDDAYYCKPSKLTEIDLKDYKPYIVVSTKDYKRESGKTVKDLKQLFNFENTNELTMPFSKTNNNGGFKSGYFVSMTKIESYPDVSGVSIINMHVPTEIEFYDANDIEAASYSKTHEEFTQSYEWTIQDDDYDYFFDAECTRLFVPDLYDGTISKLYYKNKVMINIVAPNESPVAYKRNQQVWDMIGNPDTDFNLYTDENPSQEDLNTDPSIEITNINDLVGGQTYYYCEDPFASN